MSFYDTQNPGIGGLKELTNAETTMVQQIAALGAPGADVILGYDNADASFKYFTIGSGLTYTHASHTLTASASLSGTINTIAYFDSTSSIASLALVTYPSLTEISYVKGVTSAIQTQMNLKAPLVSPTFTGNPAAPTQTPADNSTKLATTAYVDNAVLGQRYKEACKVATTANLVGTYANGSSGVGATFTYTATGADVIDGVTLALNDRVLLKNQTTDFQNGIYTVTLAGVGGVAGILTRATDFDQASDIQTGDSVFITAGTTQTSTTWAYTAIDSPTMGTTALTWAQAAGQGSFTQGNGITITGVSIAINTAVTADLTTAQNLTNKTLNGSTNVIKGVTMTLGSDGSGDLYYRNSSGILTRIAAGSQNTILKMGASSVPAWTTETFAAPGTSGNVLTSDGTNWTSAAAAGGGSRNFMFQANTFKNSLDTSNTVVSSGTVASPVADTGILISAGGTGTSSASASWFLGWSSPAIFGGSPNFSASVVVQTLNAASGAGSMYFGLGIPTVGGTGHTYTSNHIGFKTVKSGGTVNLYATQGDGSTENASASLTTLADSDDLDLIGVVNSTTSVDYYYRKNGGAKSSATNLTTNLPTAAARAMQFSTSNNSTAFDYSFFLQGAIYQR